MGKSSQPSTQTVVNKTELPAWMSAAGQDIWNQTKTASQNMPGPYTGNLIPGQSADTTAAMDMTRNNVGATNPMFGQAAGAAGQAAGYTPGQVQGQSFLSGDINQYMNPYTENVVQGAMGDLDKQRLQALNGVGQGAIAAHAFGGSRQGVMEGVTNAEAAQKAGQLSAQLRGQAYDVGNQTMQQDLNRSQQAMLANQTAGTQGAALNLQGALGLGTLAGQQQNAAFGDAAALQSIGGTQEARQAALLAQQGAQYEAQRNAPFDPISKQLMAVGAIPHDSTSTATGPAQQQTSNPWMQAAGLGLSALSLFKFSDERAKTNIEPLGKGPDGLPIYAYDYKADVAAAKKSGKPMGPKRVGPMAQDVEAAGGPVAEIGGKKIIGAMSLSGMKRRA